MAAYFGAFDLFIQQQLQMKLNKDSIGYLKQNEEKTNNSLKMRTDKISFKN